MFHENGPVQSVAKALRLLGLLMEAHQPLTLAALNEQTGWPKSTIHGLCSPSAPVRDSSGAVRYAVGVVGMFDSVRSPDFQRDIDLTCAAAAQISTALGYRA
jgi:DNA-binding IclR family transcriptional regulator